MAGKRLHHILVLTYWSFRDPLIQAYTLPYLHIILDQLPKGSKIFLVTLEQEHQKLSRNEFAQVHERLRLQGIRLIRIPYRRFGFTSLLMGIWMIFRLMMLILYRRVRTIHAWCSPAGAFAYILSKLSGRPLVIDSYEPHAEAMVENETWKKDSLQFRILFYLERKLSHHASILISATHGMREYAKARYNVDNERFFVKPACVNLNEFSLLRRKRPELLRQFGLQDKIVCVYAGKFGGIYLSKEVFRFFKLAQEHWGARFHVFLLTSHDRTELLQWAKACDFDPNAITLRFVAHADVPDFMGLGDFAITPVKPIPSKRYCTPIKDGEYWSLGLPVVIPAGISDDSDIIEQNQAGAILPKLDDYSFRDAIRKIDQLLHSEERSVQWERIHHIAEHYRNFSIARNVYEKVYGSDLLFRPH